MLIGTKRIKNNLISIIFFAMQLLPFPLGFCILVYFFFKVTNVLRTVGSRFKNDSRINLAFGLHGRDRWSSPKILIF